MNSINIKKKFNKINEHWSPKIIAQMNDYHFKLAKIKGEFVWHKHDETDETFLLINGKMKILLRESEINLSEGEMYIVPKGVEHKPVAEKECSIILIEPVGTINTGDTESELIKTIPNGYNQSGRRLYVCADVGLKPTATKLQPFICNKPVQKLNCKH